jgi:hypothetical protein
LSRDGEQSSPRWPAAGRRLLSIGNVVATFRPA